MCRNSVAIPPHWANIFINRLWGRNGRNYGVASPNPEVTKDLSDAYFFDVTNVGKTINPDGSYIITSYDINTKEYKKSFYDASSRKTMDIYLKSTAQGIALTKEIVNINKNNIYENLPHEMMPGAILQTRTFHPPAVLIPYGNIGEKFSFHTQEKLSMPASMDTIPAGTCGGPSNTLTKWEFIEQHREIEIMGRETLTIDNTQVDTIKVRILTTEHNKPKYSTCSEKNTSNPRPLYLWVAKDRGLVKRHKQQ